MACRVAEVQGPSWARLTFVLFDDAPFDLAALGDDWHQRAGIAREHCGQFHIDAIEQCPARNDAVLHDLIESRAEFTPWKRCEEQRIRGHGKWLVERANQVLAQRVIDPYFAPDRAINLREERRRYVHHWYAAQICSGGKSGDVANDTTPERDDGCRAVGVGAHQRIVDLSDGLEVLVALTIGDEDRLLFDRAGNRTPVQTPDRRARDDEPASRSGNAVEDRRDPASPARLDVHPITGRARPHVDVRGFRYLSWL